MEFRILGPVTVHSGAATLPVGGPKLCGLLAMLVLNAERVVPTEQLIAALWDEPPASVTGQLQQLVSKLRRVIAAQPGAAASVRHHSPGYVLRLATATSDLATFEAHAARGRAELAAGRAADAARSFGAALALWRGPALGDTTEPLIRQYRPALDESRLAAVEGRLDAQLALGRHREVVAALTSLVGEHPFRESLRERLMLALYRDGRQADALKAFRDGQRLLRDELGVDPGVRLRRLHETILRGEPGPAPATSGRSATPGGPAAALPEPARPNQLPSAVADFTGRGRELERVGEVLAPPTERDHATVVVVTISGLGGVGKTALAVECARRVRDRYPDGLLFVDLRGAGPAPADPTSVLAQFLRSLGVEGEAVPETLDERASLFRAIVADRRVLVVLDNAADERQVRPLVPGGSGCAVVVTSRSPLSGLEGAHRVALDVLDTGTAVDLMARVIGADRMAAEVGTAAEIARLCGHLPLAVRVAAAKLAGRPHWRLGHLAGRLAGEQGRLDELVAGDLAVRTCLAMSYQGLAPDVRRAFRLLGSIDLPDVTAWTAAAVAGTDLAGAEPLVQALTDAQLLQPARVDPTGTDRYRFHDLVRLYARERAEAEDVGPGVTAAIGRVAAAYLSIAEVADREVPARRLGIFRGGADRRPVQPGLADRLTADAIAWLDAEIASIESVVVQAAAAGLDEAAWELASCVAPYLDLSGDHERGVHVHTQAARAARAAGNRRGEAVALCHLADCCDHATGVSVHDAIGFAQRAVDLFTMAGDEYGRAAALAVVGCLQVRYDAPAAGHTALTSALTAARAADNRHAASAGEADLGRYHFQRGAFGTAAEHLARAVALARETRQSYSEALHLVSLASAKIHAGTSDQVPEALNRSLAIMTELGSWSGVVYASAALGRWQQDNGDPHAARTSYESALGIATRVGIADLRAYVLYPLGALDMEAGRYDSAVERLREAAGIYRSRGVALESARTLALLGRAQHAHGDVQSARASWQAARALYERWATPRTPRSSPPCWPGRARAEREHSAVSHAGAQDGNDPPKHPGRPDDSTHPRRPPPGRHASRIRARRPGRRAGRARPGRAGLRRDQHLARPARRLLRHLPDHRQRHLRHPLRAGHRLDRVGRARAAVRPERVLLLEHRGGRRLRHVHAHGRQQRLAAGVPRPGHQPVHELAAHVHGVAQLALRLGQLALPLHRQRLMRRSPRTCSERTSHATRLGRARGPHPGGGRQRRRPAHSGAGG